MKETEDSLRALRFPGDLEVQFRNDYFRKTITHVRIILGLGLLVTVALGATELSLPEAERTRAFLVRYALLCPSLAAILAFSFHPAFKRWAQLAVAVSVLLFPGSAAVLGLMAGTEYPDAYVRQVLMIWIIYTLTPLRLVNAAAVVWIMLLLYHTVTVRLLPGRSGLFGDDSISLLLANLFGMLAGYFREIHARREFMLHRVVRQERDRVRAERNRSERLLLNILPAAVAGRLKAEPGTIADAFGEVTVLFADLVDFTPLSARMSAGEVVELLNRVFSRFDNLAEKHGLEKIKTIGDAYMVVGGLPENREDHAEAVAAMALDMQAAISQLAREDGTPLALRIGINSGPVVAGVIGTKKFIYDLWGDAVNVASRMESSGVPGAIQVTEATYQRLKERFTLTMRGPVTIKGKGEVVTYLLTGRSASGGS